METVRPWCGQPSDGRQLKNRTEQLHYSKESIGVPEFNEWCHASVSSCSLTSLVSCRCVPKFEIHVPNWTPPISHALLVLAIWLKHFSSSLCSTLEFLVMICFELMFVITLSFPEILNSVTWLKLPLSSVGYYLPLAILIPYVERPIFTLPRNIEESKQLCLLLRIMTNVVFHIKYVVYFWI